MIIHDDRPLRFITVDVNDPAIIEAMDKALKRAFALPRAKRADSVLADLRRFVEANG